MTSFWRGLSIPRSLFQNRNGNHVTDGMHGSDDCPKHLICRNCLHQLFCLYHKQRDTHLSHMNCLLQATPVTVSVCAAGTAISIIHFFQVKRSLVSDVPTQFSWNGTPRQFVGKRWFVIYPLLVAIESASILYSKKPRTPLQLLTLCNAMAVTLVAQVWAALVARNAVNAMPGWMPKIMIALVISPTAVSYYAAHSSLQS